ncbi:MAG: hypothetical protein ABSH47_12800 [Bryobacteraceae bacterium]|jgi:hypothetical protein
MPDIDSVWLWYEFQIALIGDEHRHILRVLQPGISFDVGTLRTHELQFIGLTRSEVEQFFDDQRERLELLTIFELLATTEAVLRTEFRDRVAARKKDRLSRRFRATHKANGDKIRLDEDILVALKEEGMPTRVVDSFRGTLKLRHWLAHGRHWRPKLGREYAPSDVFDSIPP